MHLKLAASRRSTNLLVMRRVLHLFSNPPDYFSKRLSAAIRAAAGDDVTIDARTIGRGGDYRNAVIGMFDLMYKHAGDFDLIHTFDLPAFRLASRTGKVIFSPAVATPATARLIAHLPPHRTPLAVTCNSQGEQWLYVAHGLPAEKCHVLPTSVDCEGIGMAARSQLRAALGFAPADTVFLLPGQVERDSGHREALWAISILHVLDPTCRALVWGHGNRVSALQNLAEKLHQPRLLTVCANKLARETPFESLLPAADMALFAGPIPQLPLAICMAAGLPIVAPNSLWVADLLQDGRNAALVERGTPRMLAQRIAELRSDAKTLASLGSLVQAEARDHFSHDHFARRIAEIYGAGINAKRAAVGST